MVESFNSILFPPAVSAVVERQEQPQFFADLHLDYIVDAIVAGRKEYDLRPLFHTPCDNVATIRYRQDAMRELERSDIVESTVLFSGAMRRIRSNLKLHDSLYYKYNKEGTFLDTVGIYCRSVAKYAGVLNAASLTSEAFKLFRDYLNSYLRSDGFAELSSRTEAMRKELSDVHFSMQFKSGSVTVCRDETDGDYSADVLLTFEKFSHGITKKYSTVSNDYYGVGHVQAEIVDRVARLFPEVFEKLDDYCNEFIAFLDDTIVRFDREVQFYISYLQYIVRFRVAGLNFCFPVVSSDDKSVFSSQSFDMALGERLIKEKKELVCNDFRLDDSERIMVVTGPNQGGKTTFSRVFGQIHYICSLGFHVPGAQAKLLLFDNIFTHFEKEEDASSLRSNLENDLIGMRDILERAGSRSIIIINEMFNSTTLRDGILLGKKVLGKIAELDALCVCVTFLEELSRLEKAVSLVAAVRQEDPEIRTFRIFRREADGRSFAITLARKHALDREQVRRRLLN